LHSAGRAGVWQRVLVLEMRIPFRDCKKLEALTRRSRAERLVALGDIAGIRSLRYMPSVSTEQNGLTKAIDISIVILNWNTKRLLLECMRSIVATACDRRIEMIVVDNGSTDGSAEAIEHAYPDCTIIRNDRNIGFAAANNKGIRVSAGRYICLVNSDIVVLDNCLDMLCTYMDAHPCAGMIGPQVLNRDLSIQPSCTDFPSVRNVLTRALCLDILFPRIRWCRSRFMKPTEHTATKLVPALSGCFLMIRSAAIEQVGLLDERFFIYKEDVDWCKAFGDHGWDRVFYPEAKVIHYGGATSAAAPARFVREMERADLQYWRKHHTRVQANIARAISIIHSATRLFAWVVVCCFRFRNRSTAMGMLKTHASRITFLCSPCAQAERDGQGVAAAISDAS
jgi:GT2 family glycosyltransferase